MRILSIRFKNLSSLIGEWEIDFTHSAFISDGLFVLTGPTGSGKSTILDAVCLALYGETPRLGKIVKASNEIISKGTAECFAEVVFETQEGRYRCHWGQRRARRKIDGELQPPKHEISNAVTQELYDAKIRGVAKQIESVTGMDFERFTRSMLLSQGGFAAFLKAGPDQRSPILEQITGTGIYSLISKKVNERHSREDAKLRAIRLEIDGIHVFSEEKRTQIAENIRLAIEEENIVIKKIEEETRALDLLAQIADYEKKLNSVAEEKKILFEAIQAFEPKLVILKRALSALEFDGIYTKLVDLRKEREKCHAQLADSYEKMTVVSANNELFEKDAQAAAEILLKKREEQRAIMPLIKTVRELDFRISEKADFLGELERNLRDYSDKISFLEQKHSNCILQLEKYSENISDISNHLLATAADEDLLENFAGIKSHAANYRSFLVRSKEEASKIQSAEKKLESAKKNVYEKKQQTEAEKSDLDSHLKEIEKKTEELNNILNGKTLSDFHKEHLLFCTRKETLEKIIKSYEEYAKLSEKREKLTEKNNEVEKELVFLDGETVKLRESETEIENKLRKAESDYLKTQQILQLQEHRNTLKEGEPCPLCGSFEHPYLKNVFTVNQDFSVLDKVRTELKKINQLSTENKIKYAQKKAEFASVITLSEEYMRKQTELLEFIHNQLSSLGVEAFEKFDDKNLKISAAGMLESAKLRIKDISSIIDDTEKMTELISKLREKADYLKSGVSECEKRFNDAIQAEVYAEKELEGIKKLALRTDSDVKEFGDKFSEELKKFGIELFAGKDLDLILCELNERRQTRIAKKNKKIEIEKQMASLEVSIKADGDQIFSMKKEKELLETKIENADKELSQYRAKRNELFGNKNPDTEETEYISACDDAEKVFRDLAKKAENSRGELIKINSSIEGFTDTLKALDESVQSVQKNFIDKIASSEFKDEDDFVSANISQEKRTVLKQESKQLTDEETRLLTREKELANSLDNLKKNKVTDDSYSVISERRVLLEDKCRKLREEIGALNQQLNDNDRLKEKYNNRLSDLDNQKKEYLRWKNLYELIGSSDGKKFRTFAQGLTFEIMLGHANRQLKLLTDRYLLVPDPSLPLELNILDNYQAGEIRSAKNLSGGESFLVSLALALGLSKMSSRNVRIDSLFLDEGFGTLDSEALDSAVEALAGLRSDGKMIGLISHVSALKDRISTQIKVTPLSGGRSIISGPGVKRLD